MSLIDEIRTPELVLFEDEHLLVINKPPGINTHSPSPFSSEGIYEWLRNRDPKWESLVIHQRLDRETSGVLLFGKTREANQSLSKQFENRTVKKTYHLLTEGPSKDLPRVVKSSIGKVAGGKFDSTNSSHGAAAETHFRKLGELNGRALIEAEPVTGRTHQIRIHARDSGFPILGDTTYGGSPYDRVCLHAYSLKLRHPKTNAALELVAPIQFSWNPNIWLRASLWGERNTNAWRLLHGASEDRPGWYVDRLGDFLLSQSENDLNPTQQEQVEHWLAEMNLKGAYHKTLDRRVRKTSPEHASPRHLCGKPARSRFDILENGVRYSMSFEEGYSVGLFLDQKDNRNRLLSGHVFPATSTKPKTPHCRTASPQPLETRKQNVPLSGKSVLNTFAYTCGFSVCAARAGATVTSLDLSKKYLDWGRDNFRLNNLDPEEHDFIYGDCFNWMKRLAKKGREFDLILLDPPTFSKSKESGTFKADRHYGRLIGDALKLLAPDGILFASTNCATLSPDSFLTTIRDAVEKSNRNIISEFYAPQPPDFPTSSAEQPYLKTVWFHAA